MVLVCLVWASVAVGMHHYLCANMCACGRDVACAVSRVVFWCHRGQKAAGTNRAAEGVAVRYRHSVPYATQCACGLSHREGGSDVYRHPSLYATQCVWVIDMHNMCVEYLTGRECTVVM